MDAKKPSEKYRYSACYANCATYICALNARFTPFVDSYASVGKFLICRQDKLCDYAGGVSLEGMSACYFLSGR